jgi:phosphatidylinositol-3,4,5-trisphosphate 3-phosphatase and dual-specificity protein phosphatase PTEN
MIIEFCEDVRAFLDGYPNSIVGIHCKAGKGRTGLMISCYLVYTGFCQNALEALVYYGNIRTKNSKGVTIPSQIRYVYYFEHFIKQRRINKSPSWRFPKTIYKLFKIRMITIPTIEKGGFTPNFTVTCQETIFYDFVSEDSPD